MRELWIAHRESRQRRHRQWHVLNREALVKAGVPFTDKGETLLFREPGMPSVDFYPSTGRWRVGDRFLSGGASIFLAWYEEHRQCQTSQS